MRLGRADVDGAIRYGAVEGGSFRPFAGDRLGGPGLGVAPIDLERPQLSEQVVDLGAVSLRSPTEPGRVFAVLGGFFPADQAPPADRPDPLLVPKAVSAVGGDGDPIVYPAFADPVCIEAEMALVIGRPVRGATVDEARAAILGFTCCNDVTAPQFFPQFYLAKCIDTFCTAGPFVTTEVTDEQIRDGLAITARVNGATVQEGSTRYYKHSPAEVVSYLSTFTTLLPGDLITLGTPPPAPEVRPGDEVEVEVEGIGVLTNRVVADDAEA